MGELKHSEVCWRCPSKDAVPYKTISLEETILQDRLVNSFEQAIKNSMHLYVADCNLSIVERVIQNLIERFDTKPVPNDILCVNHFNTPDEPTIITVPASTGRAFQKDMDHFIKARQQYPRTVVDEVNDALAHDYSWLVKEAKKQGIALRMITPQHYEFSSKTVLGSEKENRNYQATVASFHNTHVTPFIQKSVRNVLNRKNWEDYLETRVEKHVHTTLQDLKKKYAQNKELRDHLTTLEKEASSFGNEDNSNLLDFKVNLLVDNASQDSAPLCFEHQPSYENLIGELPGATKKKNAKEPPAFLKIKAGSLAQASGGYLIINVNNWLNQNDWETTFNAIKQVMHTGTLTIENTSSLFGSDVELPEITVNPTIIFYGPSHFYHHLCHYDSDFSRLVRIHADFDGSVPNSAGNRKKHATFYSRITREKKLLSTTQESRAALIEHAARLSEHRHHLSTDFDTLTEILTGSDMIARNRHAKGITRDDVENAIQERFHRNSLLYDKELDFNKLYSLIQVTGEKVGQINGLGVYDLGDVSFGVPERITASTSVGNDGIVYSDVEAQLAGETLTKSTYIIDGYITGKYCQHHPLKLSAKITWEQSYCPSDGDSASLADVLALLAALSKTPIKQSLAFTGSMDKFGNVQPVGRVNEKTEGFYDACITKTGLTGEQGVVIPQHNLQNIMLRRNIIHSIKDGRFHIHPVKRIEQAIELAMGQSSQNIDYLVREELERLYLAYKNYGKKS